MEWHRMDLKTRFLKRGFSWRIPGSDTTITIDPPLWLNCEGITKFCNDHHPIQALLWTHNLLDIVDICSILKYSSTIFVWLLRELMGLEVFKYIEQDIGAYAGMCGMLSPCIQCIHPQDKESSRIPSQSHRKPHLRTMVSITVLWCNWYSQQQQKDF